MQFTIYETEIGQEHESVTSQSAELPKEEGGESTDADDNKKTTPTTTRNDATLSVEVWNKNTFQVGRDRSDLSLQ